jgi:hypothetical protein
MPDRRKGSPPVSRLQFWLGIGVMFITFGGGLLRLSSALFEAAKWPDKVDSSINTLTEAVTDLKGVAATMQREQSGMKAEIQRRTDVDALQQRQIDQLESRRRSPRVPVLSAPGSTVQ